MTGEYHVCPHGPCAEALQAAQAALQRLDNLMRRIREERHQVTYQDLLQVVTEPARGRATFYWIRPPDDSWPPAGRRAWPASQAQRERPANEGDELPRWEDRNVFGTYGEMHFMDAELEYQSWLDFLLETAPAGPVRGSNGTACPHGIPHRWPCDNCVAAYTKGGS